MLKVHPLASALLNGALRVLAWATVAAIAFVTLGPLRDRPVITRDPQVERCLAFFALGAVFSLAYPRRPAIVFTGLLTCAFGLEAAQHLTPDRHGELPDALAKALGASVGLVMGELIARIVYGFGPAERA